MGLLELSPRSKVGTILQWLKGAVKQLNKVDFVMTFIAFYLFNVLRTLSLLERPYRIMYKACFSEN